MLQIRLKEGSDKRWFNPQRDIAYLWPLLIRKSLMSFDDFQGTPECSLEELTATAGEYGALMARIITTPVMHDAAQQALQEIESRHPAAMNLIKNRAFHVLHGVYAAWIADAKPKAGTDAEIPVYGLEQVATQLAKAAESRKKLV